MSEFYVLGSAIQAPIVVPEILSSLNEEDFSLDQNKRLFKTLKEMSERDEAIDPITVINRYTKNSYDGSVTGSRDYVLSVMETSAGPSNIEFHIDIIKEKSLLRNLERTANAILKATKDPRQTSKEILNELSEKIYDLMEGREDHPSHRIGDIMDEIFANIGNPKHQILTGFQRFDEITSGGLTRGNLITIAALTGKGKTIFASMVARNAALAGKTVLFFTLEMNNIEIITRTICSTAQVNQSYFKDDSVTKEEFQKIINARDSLYPTNLFMNDNPNTNIQKIRAECKKIKRRHGLDLVVVDYLQLIEEKGENRTVIVSKISRNLKLLAKSMNVPVLAVSQLNRGTTKDGKQRPPTLSDLKESGSIEQDSDIVLFLDDTGIQKAEGNQVQEIKLLVSKHRNGPYETINLTYVPEWTYLTNAGERIVMNSYE
jgi:replicative DNA helicase